LRSEFSKKFQKMPRVSKGRQKLAGRKFKSAPEGFPERFERQPPTPVRRQNLSLAFLDGHRANLDELMVVVMSPPVPPFTVPVTVMAMMPVRVIPITIPAIFVCPCNQRSAEHRTKDSESQK
jgi:hypothetical protein